MKKITKGKKGRKAYVLVRVHNPTVKYELKVGIEL